MTLQDYLHALQGKRVAVIGIGVSNQPLLRLLLEAGVSVTACDKKDRAALGPMAHELEAAGCALRLGEDYLEGLDQDVIFRTPGLHPRYLEAARARGSVVTSEMEVFFEVCPCPILAVTGSDGKTTTTTIIARLLQAAGHKVHLGGNIGHPLLSEADDIRPEDWAVVELSSFQLLTMRRSPRIAVLTNLAPNHLDIHTDMAEYINAKAALLTTRAPTAPLCATGTTTSPESSPAEPVERFFTSHEIRSKSPPPAAFCGGRPSGIGTKTGSGRSCRWRIFSCPGSTTWRTAWPPSVRSRASCRTA